MTKSILGDVLRIGPDEVSLNGFEAYDFLYSQKTKFRKDDTWYYGIIPREVINIFTVTEKETHSGLKRLFSHAFSRTNILNFQPTIQTHVDLAMEHIQTYIEANKAISLYDLATSYTLDTISKISFGNRIGALDRPTLDDPLLGVLGSLFRETIPVWVCFSTIRISRIVLNLGRDLTTIFYIVSVI